MTRLITIAGVVQGVGFRPFAARLAEELLITGYVLNAGGVVKILAQGDQKAVETYLHRLQTNLPPGSMILEFLEKPGPEEKTYGSFSILKSSEDGGNVTPVLPPDLPTCDRCLSELYDPENRRYQYPFISCTSCGPRYSMIEAVPYDRETTSMKEFDFCNGCKSEYQVSPHRRHAQTISCEECGPQLIFQYRDKTILLKTEALAQAVKLLNCGKVLAVKGVGGYQYVCSPYSLQAVTRLRQLKRRGKKPLAIMFPTVEAIQKACILSEQEEELVKSTARPIVLLCKGKELFSEEVAGESPYVGAFLPYTGLHHLLTKACGPLVVTSANQSGEPIITDDETMLCEPSPLLDGFLYHTRKIVTPLDDSVVRVAAGKNQTLRRSRGYVPLPLFLAGAVKAPILALGGDLKAGFCLLAGNRAYLSQYFGDMEHLGIQQAYRDSLNHMESLLGISPKLIIHDSHPGYYTTQLAKKLGEKYAGIPLMPVQHHHAHAASVMAEHRLSSCIGVTFDGTGYGPDGTIWGGEFLLCTGREYRRAGCLEPVLLLGGDASAKDSGLTALCHLAAAGLTSHDSRFPIVLKALRHQINIHVSSSAGRFFDAVSALLGLKIENGYEGECAIALENAAAEALRLKKEPAFLPFPIIKQDHCYVLQRTEAVRTLMRNLLEGEDKEALALGFHFGLSQAITELCRKIREDSHENRVALTGGVFANRILTEECVHLLSKEGFQVYLNQSVPPNDGGLCLGQAYLAAMEQEVS